MHPHTLEHGQADCISVCVSAVCACIACAGDRELAQIGKKNKTKMFSITNILK